MIWGLMGQKQVSRAETSYHFPQYMWEWYNYLSLPLIRQQSRPALVQIMTCLLFGTKPLSEQMLAQCKLDRGSVKFESGFKTFSCKKISFKNVVCKLVALLFWSHHVRSKYSSILDANHLHRFHDEYISIIPWLILYHNWFVRGNHPVWVNMTRHYKTINYQYDLSRSYSERLVRPTSGLGPEYLVLVLVVLEYLISVLVLVLVLSIKVLSTRTSTGWVLLVNASDFH